jgi:hypothetical protein
MQFDSELSPYVRAPRNAARMVIFAGWIIAALCYLIMGVKVNAVIGLLTGTDLSLALPLCIPLITTIVGMVLRQTGFAPFIYANTVLQQAEPVSMLITVCFPPEEQCLRQPHLDPDILAVALRPHDQPDAEPVYIDIHPLPGDTYKWRNYTEVAPVYADRGAEGMIVVQTMRGLLIRRL